MNIPTRAVAFILAAFLLFQVGSFVYMAHALDQAEQKSTSDQRKFCDVIDTVVEAYRDYPTPTTDLGKKLKVEYIELQERLGCT